MESVATTYGDLLKDPRWQRKRLEIFNRDGWECQHCFEKNKTLNIHHIKYIGEYPWETPDKYLITLCEDCHKEETNLKWCDLINMATNAGITRHDIWQIIALTNFRIQQYGGKYPNKIRAMKHEVFRKLLASDELDDFVKSAEELESIE